MALTKFSLKIFVAEHCSGCREAQQIAVRVARQHPQPHVEVIDINRAGDSVPEVIFATPTYMLNDRVVSLGNPSPVEIDHWAANAISGI